MSGKFFNISERRFVIAIPAFAVSVPYKFDRETVILSITCPMPPSQPRRLKVGSFDADLRILYAESIRPHGPAKIRHPPYFVKGETAEFGLIDLDGHSYSLNEDVEFYVYVKEVREVL